jgi:hypothetical protein
MLALSWPPSNLADKFVTASSGARQNPLHETDRAFSFTDFNCETCAIHSS